MSLLTVSVSAAVLCFANHCYPALVGKTTPTGVFQVERRATLSPGYGGEFLQFYEGPDYVLSVHRVWTLKPSEHRLQRLKSPNPKDRVITHGCINVSPEVYEKIENADILEIIP